MPAVPNIFQGFQRGLSSFTELLPDLRHFWKMLKRILASLCRWIHERQRRRRGGCCIDIPITEYKRPDPLLYSQFFLMKQGLAVTWDNPDIQLYDNGVPINSSSLVADHDYELVVRVWNNSYEAPAANLPVYLSYLDFGVGTSPILVGKTYIDLGVKGSSLCPAFAKFKWHTPQTSGHYCLQVWLDWPDDANPDNNLGQENTNVGQMLSPAKFTFTVRNGASIDRRYQLEADTYQVPEPDPCSPQTEPVKGPNQRMTRLTESRMRWAKALETHGYGKFPISADWKLTIEPNTFTLSPDQEVVIHVEIEHINGNFIGQQSFNINALASSPYRQREVVGGVTLVVKGGQ